MEMEGLKMAAFKKMNILLVIIVFFIVSIGAYMQIGIPAASEKPTPKLSKPKMRKAGTYVISKKEKFCEILSSDQEDSIIRYTKDDSIPHNWEFVYERPVPIVEDGKRSLCAVNTKEGYQDSEIAERHYMYSLGLPPSPVHGIKVNKIKSGAKKISGRLKFYRSKVIRYIRITVKQPNAAAVKYNTKVRKGKWAAALKTKLTKGTKIHIKAYTKDDIVEFKKEKIAPYKNTMQVTRYSTGSWYPVNIMVR